MKTLVIYSLVLTSLFAQAQDRIIFRNGTLQNAKVLEVGTNNVVYKKAENINGPNYVADKNQISVIEYANGSRDAMAYTAPENNNYNYPASPQNNPSYSVPAPAPTTTYIRPQVNVVVPPVTYGAYGAYGGFGGYGYNPYYNPGLGGYYGGGLGLVYRGGFGGHHHGGHHRW